MDHLHLFTVDIMLWLVSAETVKVTPGWESLSDLSLLPGVGVHLVINELPYSSNPLLFLKLNTGKT